MPSKGEIWVDDGAARAIKKHASLFAAGITKVVGEFQHQDAVKLCDAQGRELAQGLTNYGNVEVEAAKGLSSAKFLEKLGYQGQEEVVHRASICLLVKREQGEPLSLGLMEAGGWEDERFWVSLGRQAAQGGGKVTSGRDDG